MCLVEVTYDIYVRRTRKKERCEKTRRLQVADEVAASWTQGDGGHVIGLYRLEDALSALEALEGSLYIKRSVKLIRKAGKR